jgi:large subunit ribosomal protein L32
MATPRKKISKHKRNVRHSKWLDLNLNRLSEQYMQTKCTNCAKYKLAHRVCPHCGFYKGKQIITIKTGGKTILEA